MGIPSNNASAVAVSNVVSQLQDGFRHLVFDLRQPPSELITMVNELRDLQVILQLVRDMDDLWRTYTMLSSVASFG